jgi:hypothetical protein
MAEEHTVTNATLYSLLQAAYKLLDTVHVNQVQIIIPDLNVTRMQQTEIIIPDLAALDGTALRMDLDSKFAVINTTLIALGAKLDQISAQITPPETGDTNVATAKIS